jgi:hypothetical protein
LLPGRWNPEWTSVWIVSVEVADSRDSVRCLHVCPAAKLVLSRQGNERKQSRLESERQERARRREELSESLLLRLNMWTCSL